MLIQYINRFIKVIRTRGFAEAGLRLLRRILAVCVVVLILLMWPFKKIRLIKLRSTRIGHFADNVHLSLCALKYNTFPEEKNCLHLYYTQTYLPICNLFLYKMWSRVIKIVPPWGAFWVHIDDMLTAVLKKRYRTPFKKIFDDSVGGYDIWNFHQQGKNQFLFFSDEEKRAGEALKIKLGIPADKKFVCLLVRDAEYVKNVMPDSLWHNENFRNADIHHYIPAVQFLIQQGFYVVRMGKYVENSIDIGDPRFIDYANHPIKSDFMDIYLSGNCFFFIGTSCGLDSVPRIFNRPVVTTNAIFFQEKIYMNWAFIIFKNIFCTKTQAFVPYQTVFNDYAHFILSGKYTNHRDPIMAAWKEKGWVFIENTPDEILEVVREMLDTLMNPIIETPEMKALQLLFWENFPYELAHGETSYEKISMRVSPAFIKKNYSLLAKSPQLTCKVD
ncbi:MAG: hypothetical protein COY58_02025 [Gammaproteobacteria bacterium CG_4_10_14_0_8_um_filter_38_16]|nr:MAG: hypothetical protein COY58_02025 [Gammaproteobacteria bacterium CG_4_10_14_0_8_um_filter_38_16]PJA04092.1 MAG: hypothetical protein COX72_01810 [Gammaproteobacteria bacterium CG_4_10_14_0_2_um_filter_38_22]PJB10042.1 MAG: hypothetical protein CO120_07095 [Gammaproteobacteria bacterium CG_4_9_14_3_um_filter_38_9]